MSVSALLRMAIALAAVATLAAAAPSPALAGTYGERLVSEGHEFFRAGNFFRASESYRCAVLEEPADGMKKLDFGHSLFALGNYAYAAYSFRRGVRYLGYPDDLRIHVSSLFPSPLSYERSMRDVRRYAGYYPSDPHALTVIAYTAFFGGDHREAEGACRKLIQLDARDQFAAYIMRRIELEGAAPPGAAGAGGPRVRPEAAQPSSGGWAEAGEAREGATRQLEAGGQHPTAPAVAPIGPIATIAASSSSRGGAGSASSAEPAVALRRPPPAPVSVPAPVAVPERKERKAPVAAAEAVELPPGERSSAVTTLSTEELKPALAR